MVIPKTETRLAAGRQNVYRIRLNKTEAFCAHKMG
jgi:hypothetical protein